MERPLRIVVIYLIGLGCAILDLSVFIIGEELIQRTYLVGKIRKGYGACRIHGTGIAADRHCDLFFHVFRLRRLGTSGQQGTPEQNQSCH